MHSLPPFGIMNGRKFPKWFLVTTFISRPPPAGSSIDTMDWFPSPRWGQLTLISLTVADKHNHAVENSRHLDISTLPCFQNMRTGTTGSSWGRVWVLRAEVPRCWRPVPFQGMPSSGDVSERHFWMLILVQPGQQQLSSGFKGWSLSRVLHLCLYPKS